MRVYAWPVLVLRRRDSLDKVEASEQLVVEPPHHLLDSSGQPGAKAAGVAHHRRVVLDVICAVES